MIFTKSIICKLLLLTLLCCCLTNGYAAKITKTKTKSVAANTTAVEEETTQKITQNEAPNKANAADNDNDDDDDDDNEDDDDDDENDNTSLEATLNAAEKNALQPAAPSSLSVWGIVRGVWNWIKSDLTEGLFGEDDTTSAVGEGRTFGKIRRLQMALIPIVFKFGVLTAMVAFLVAIGLKTLFFVKMLLAMNALVLLGKFFTLKTNFGHYEHVAPPPSWSWSPHSLGGWSSSGPAAVPEHHPTKEIHLHIHGAQGHPQVQAYSSSHPGSSQSSPQVWERRSDPYSAYQNLALHDNNELTSSVSSALPATQQVIANYPANHRMF